MALDALRCNHLAPLGFKGLKNRATVHYKGPDIHKKDVVYVTFVRRTQVVETFGNITSPFCTLCNL